MQVETCLIMRNDKIAKNTYRMQLQGKIAQDMKPGQFVNIKVDGYMLRRPISICSVESKNEFVIVYKVVGDGTKVLSELSARRMLDVFGPLGSSYPIHEELDEVLLIGGGVGVPPLYELAKQYRAINKKVNVVLGFNDAASVFYVNEFERLGASVVVATMDGSYGVKGTVMDAIKEKATAEKYADNKAAGEKFLAENKAKEGVVTTPSGLQYKIITKGNGAVPADSSKVKVNYKGTLIDGTEFDSSYKRNEPATFRANQVIKGWTEALTMMPVGSKWELYIPYDLAYGSRETGSQIKPFSTLIFEVELLGIEK